MRDYHCCIIQHAIVHGQPASLVAPHRCGPTTAQVTTEGDDPRVRQLDAVVAHNFVGRQQQVIVLANASRGGPPGPGGGPGFTWITGVDSDD